MKTKLEMTMQMIVAEVRRVGITSIDNDKVIDAWNLADAMQAEADKREKEANSDTNAKFDMYLEYDASINYPPDAWVMYKGEKRLAVSIDIEKEWQPDWSQAPDWASWWSVDENGTANFSGKKPNIEGRQWVYYSAASENLCHIEAPSFGYTGDWRNSLRKRPE